MTPADPIGHDELDETATRLRLAISGSELHGSLCGFLAGGGQPGRQSLLKVLHLDAEQVSPSAKDQALLAQLITQSADELADSDLSFEPLLPSDDRSLAERADALVDWCRGFLGGFGLTGASAHAKLSDEAQEIMRDLGAIAGSSFDFGDENEDEDALIEVHEFVRMGAMLLFAECHIGDHTGSDTLH